MALVSFINSVKLLLYFFTKYSISSRFVIFRCRCSNSVQNFESQNIFLYTCKPILMTVFIQTRFYCVSKLSLFIICDMASLEYCQHVEKSHLHRSNSSNTNCWAVVKFFTFLVNNSRSS